MRIMYAQAKSRAENERLTEKKSFFYNMDYRRSQLFHIPILGGDMKCCLLYYFRPCDVVSAEVDELYDTGTEVKPLDVSVTRLSNAFTD